MGRRDARTEGIQAEKKHRQLGQRLQAILASIPDIIMEVDLNKVYTWANAAGLEFFGPDVIGQEAAYYFEGEQDTYSKVESLFKGDESVIYVESWQRRRDGQKRLLSWWCKSLKNIQGRTIGALSTARDITDQKKAEQELEERDRHLQELVRIRSSELERTHQQIEKILQSAGEGIFGVDLQGRLTLINEAGSRMLDWKAEDLIGQDIRPIIHAVRPDGMSSAGEECLIQRVLTSGLPFSEAKAQYRRKDGTFISVEFTGAPILSGDSPIGAVIVFRDITERIQAEEERWTHVEDLEKFNKAMIDREKRIIEIKEEVNRLCLELGREPKYPIVWE
ncbi:MAG: hypothetical protein A2Y69_15515 [Candidatus Aminicenantes bacterium RBG_13_59_9]|nr:MAG: hypothetical protein A2Y69_15515 [Candidatus Aminicenantes bacterium RBG_13_59_9]